MARKVFSKLDFETIKRINWANADLIRDKGNGKNEDTYKIVFPLITLKRFMDMREEFKIKEIRNRLEYEFEDFSLVRFLETSSMCDDRFKVDYDLVEWYDVEWEDILRFKENKDGDELEIHLGDPDDEDYDHRLTIKTRAKTQTEFLFQVIESFDNDIIKEMLKEYDFENTFHKVLPRQYQREAIETFKDVKYYLEYADEDVFGDVYMDITSRFASEGGKKGGEFFTPTELTKAITRMRDPKITNQAEFKLGDIASGACTFMVYAAEHMKEQRGWTLNELNSRIKIVTQEKEKNSEIFGKLNLSFHGFREHISYHANSIINWKETKDKKEAIGVWEGKMDCILANPPYGLNDYGFEYAEDNRDYENRWKYGVPSKSDGEYAFLVSIINLLNANGEAAVIMPLGTLFKDSTKLIRERLVKDGLVEAIVNMPSSMFLTTSIPVCVWFLKKGRSQEEIDKGIYMMEASECFEKDGKINRFSGDKVEEAISIFLERKEVEGFSKYITLDLIEDGLYNLSVSRYVYNSINKTNIKIKELNKNIENIYNLIIKNNNILISSFKKEV